jgi:PAS domain S-box-containing protein
MSSGVEVGVDGHRSEQERALLAFARLAISIPDPPGLWAGAAKAIVDTFQVGFGAVAEVERSTDGRTIRIRAEAGEDALRGAAAAASSQLALTLERDERVFSENALEDPRFSRSERERELGVTTRITVPIPGPEKPRGVVIAGSRLPRPFTEAELDRLDELAGLLAAGLDRMDRKHKLARYEAMVGLCRDAFLVMRADGKLLAVNPAAVDLYGFSEEELLDRSIIDLRAAATLPELIGQMRQASMTGVLFETEHRRKDGSTVKVEVSSHGAMLEGEHVLVSVIRRRG